MTETRGSTAAGTQKRSLEKIQRIGMTGMRAFALMPVFASEKEPGEAGKKN